MKEIELKKRVGTVEYFVQIDDEYVLVGEYDYGSATMSGTSGGARTISFIDFLEGEGHDLILENFSKEELTQIAKAVKELVKE